MEPCSDSYFLTVAVMTSKIMNEIRAVYAEVNKLPGPATLLITVQYRYCLLATVCQA